MRPIDVETNLVWILEQIVGFDDDDSQSAVAVLEEVARCGLRRDSDAYAGAMWLVEHGVTCGDLRAMVRSSFADLARSSG